MRWGVILQAGLCAGCWTFAFELEPIRAAVFGIGAGILFMFIDDCKERRGK